MNDGVMAELPLTTPGEVLVEEFIKPLGLTQKQVAEALHLPPARISELVKGNYRINGEFALRLSACFGNSARFWLNLQAQYDLEKAERESGESIRSTVQQVPIGC